MGRVAFVPDGPEAPEPWLVLDDWESVFGQQGYRLLRSPHAVVLADGDEQRRSLASDGLHRATMEQHGPKAHLGFVWREVAHVLHHPHTHALVGVERCLAVVIEGDPDRLAGLADEAEVEPEAGPSLEDRHDSIADALCGMVSAAGLDQLAFPKQRVHGLRLTSAVAPG
jgi:hypothetical protein